MLDVIARRGPMSEALQRYFRALLTESSRNLDFGEVIRQIHHVAARAFVMVRETLYDDEDVYYIGRPQDKCVPVPILQSEFPWS
jgi:hypothetical protein